MMQIATTVHCDAWTYSILYSHHIDMV